MHVDEIKFNYKEKVKNAKKVAKKLEYTIQHSRIAFLAVAACTAAIFKF